MERLVGRSVGAVAWGEVMALFLSLGVVGLRFFGF